VRFAIAIPFFWFNPSIELSDNGGPKPRIVQIKIPRLQRGIIDLLWGASVVPDLVITPGRNSAISRPDTPEVSDLGFRKTRIFLQTGLDRQITDLPVRRQTAGLGCFAKPIAVIQNMIGIASAFAR
jgi:hypothetical protein